MKASIDVLPQTFLNQILNFQRRRWRQRLVVGLSLEHGRNGIVYRFSGKRLPAGEQLKQDAPKRPNIRALVQQPAANLVRAQVCRRGEDPSLAWRFSAERRQLG